MDIMQQEIFGPITPIMAFDDFEEAVALANDSQYGLSAYLFTNDLKRMMHAVQAIRFGEIYINKIGPEQFQGFHTRLRPQRPGRRRRPARLRPLLPQEDGLCELRRPCDRRLHAVHRSRRRATPAIGLLWTHPPPPCSTTPPAGQPAALLSLNPFEARTAAAIFERCFPPTRRPGATALGVMTYLDRALAGAYRDKAKPTASGWPPSIRSRSRRYGHPFAACDAAAAG